MFKENRKIQFSLSVWAILGGCFLFLTPLSHAEDEPSSGTFQKFYVYDTKQSHLNHFYPSGWMPDGKCIKMHELPNCKDTESCIQWKFDVDCSTNDTGWAGVFWQDPSNNWGDMKGGFKLTGAKKLVFWAKGEKGGEVVEFKMGGIGAGHPYADTDTATSGSVTLTQDWQEYSIDLSGLDLSHIVGGFCWVAKASDGTAGTSMVFYMTNIYYTA